MGRTVWLMLFIVAGIGGWWVWETQPTFRNTLEQYVENSDFMTLEARFTADQIMERNRKNLLADAQHTYQEPQLKFYPYLYMDVKYVQADKKTKEGVILWCLTDGEMVLDTENWEKTHGFEDAINANANRNDFKILQALAKSNGSLTLEQLQNELRVEENSILPWLKSTVDKHLVIQSGNEYQLHFQNPRLWVVPQTRMKHQFVTRSTYQSQRMAREYGAGQIEKITQAAFGPAFTIRETKEVFLPVYAIGVLNPDGTTLTSYWNAVSGQPLGGGPLHP